MEQVCEAQPTVDLAQGRPVQKRYGGIRRLGYFLGILGAAVLCEVCTVIAHSKPGVTTVGWNIALAISFILVVNRLRNIGMGGWAVILTFVPLWNVYIGIKCLVCQEGYEATKKLDTTGRMIVGVSIGLILGLILLSVGDLLIDVFVIASLVISFTLAVNRLRNIGDVWTAILIFVPVWNVYIGIKCLICQEGCEDPKRLDATGRMILGVAIGLIFGVILLGVGNLLVDTFAR